VTLDDHGVGYTGYMKHTIKVLRDLVASEEKLINVAIREDLSVAETSEWLDDIIAIKRTLGLVIERDNFINGKG
jgi:hypothetical protein